MTLHPHLKADDPMFWMHHGFVDYPWWKWQGDNETRINHDLNNIGYVLNGILRNRIYRVIYIRHSSQCNVADVLDTQTGLLCCTCAV
ncbi:hypothetical protein IW261DRAFT_1492359 [Armillaria novae-zelandiae]|uniref:Tyrosinase copper-binding domain-containing protein n=1 Tax=Armillaria novae-zelandiae TaxID=153914 RepID=A0AA39P2W8_9AGAR|nr:hypothetical protein IW261DRAFT_1492359 [Armillaria novae-zelandiae]